MYSSLVAEFTGIVGVEAKVSVQVQD